MENLYAFTGNIPICSVDIVGLAVVLGEDIVVPRGDRLVGMRPDGTPLLESDLEHILNPSVPGIDNSGIPWNQRSDVAQGVNIIEAGQFGALGGFGGNVKVDYGRCCKNGEIRHFVKGGISFGPGVSVKARSQLLKLVARTLKRVGASKGIIDQYTLDLKKCPKEGWDVDFYAESIFAIYSVKYSALGDVLRYLDYESTSGIAPRGKWSGGPDYQLGAGVHAAVYIGFVKFVNE